MLDRLDALHTARNALCRVFLCNAFGEAGQHDGAVERLDTDAARIDKGVLNKACFDQGGNARVVNVSANGFLTAVNRTTDG